VLARQVLALEPAQELALAQVLERVLEQTTAQERELQE
jgi:hypothetical protein